MTTDQPASSLEEARERLYWKIQGARSHMAMVREADEAFAEYDSHIKAAARAEVIREVEEAVVVLGESGVLDIYQRSRISIRLRAL